MFLSLLLKTQILRINPVADARRRMRSDTHAVFQFNNTNVNVKSEQYQLKRNKMIGSF